jgi:hypothetical protein
MGFGGIPGVAFPNPTCVLVPPFLFANRNQFICVINGPGQICRQSKNLPRELIEQPKIRYSEELAGISVQVRRYTMPPDGRGQGSKR